MAIVDAYLTICLTGFVVFAFFWIRTPPGEHYETVDRVWMKKKRAFGICALVMLIGWIYGKSI